MLSTQSGSSHLRCWPSMCSLMDKPRFDIADRSVRQPPRYFGSLGRWKMGTGKTDGAEWKTREVSATRALKRKLGERAARHKDEQAKWKRDHPDTEPGVSFKRNTWKGVSKIRFPSKHFIENFDLIDWNG